MQVDIAIQWQSGPVEGQIVMLNGSLIGGRVAAGQGSFEICGFGIESQGPCRLELSIEADNLQPGAHPTMVKMETATNPFTFFLRDVGSAFPIWIPAYEVTVTPAEDPRDYRQIVKAIDAMGLQSKAQQINSEPEQTWDDAAANCRELIHPAWMGISRDIRVFETGLRKPMVYTDWVCPRWHGRGYFWPEEDYTSGRYGFLAGRGWNCTEVVERRLDEGVLPIQHVARTDDDIRYDHVSFVTLEKSTLTPEAIRGTHYLVADGMAACCALNEEQMKTFLELKVPELEREEETIFCCRITATNMAATPRHAFFKTIYPCGTGWGDSFPHTFDRENGCSSLEGSDLVYGISKLDGKPLGQEEISILLQPGQSTVYEFILPHQPISLDRAKKLGEHDILKLLDEVRKFWNDKLDAAADIRLPEKRIEEMLKAGLLHIDQTTYGLEPDGILAISNGMYSSLAQETWLNVAWFDSLGLHSLARRGINFFLSKQDETGFIQNFEGYIGDPGAVLYSVGEHYRYTRDEAWAVEVGPAVRKTCDWIVGARQKSKTDEFRKRGYGMIRGKVADPPDDEFIYMLNAFACTGLFRSAELLAKSDPQYSAYIAKEAESYKADILESFAASFASGPVVPLGSGAWCPTTAPWAGAIGPKCLFVDGKNWWTHATISGRDDMIGPLHMVSEEIVGPHETTATMMLDYHTDMLFSRNMGGSQPYLSRHYYVHLLRDEVKLFLKAYYNTFAALADRSTYFFWEHLYHESPNKTHEQAEFLLQTRLMLYLEDGDALYMLRGAPRAWLEDGKRIDLKNVVSYFGKLSASIVSRLNEGFIEAELTCESDHKPGTVVIRLPHPNNRLAVRVEGGEYDPKTESIVVKNFTGKAKVRAYFQA